MVESKLRFDKACHGGEGGDLVNSNPVVSSLGMHETLHCWGSVPCAVLHCFLRVVVPWVMCSYFVGVWEKAFSFDELLLRRICDSWKEYQEMQIEGTATRYGISGVEEVVPFRVSIGKSERGKAAPVEIGFPVPNPGEPHIESDEIFMEAVAFTSDVNVLFLRNRLISEPPFRQELVTLRLEPYQTTVGPSNWIDRALLVGLDGSPTRLSSGVMPAILKRCTLEVIGNEKYMGFDVKRVVFTMKMDEMPSGEVPPPLRIEHLVALEPTFQVLKSVSVQGGPSGYADNHRESYIGRTVESAKVMGKWLICDRVKFPAKDGHLLIEMHNVRTLPADYAGLWDYTKLTGVVVGGRLEQATRKGSGRLTMESTNEFTYVPYTEAEQEKIRQFIISKTRPIEPSISWGSVFFWVANIVAVFFLGYVGYRYYRFG